MGEQNRRALDLEPAPPAVGPRRRAPAATPPSPADRDRAQRALGPEADERQTLRQAPTAAAPGESAEGDTIG
ncbi:hypothetical protein [Phenylobacterium sp.]|uniref:hypothetical protein n=1 Tax=Phenylobacterium sp. TaxID=1871053 RepID=UPI0025D3CCE1|nr:hypothetical protein [Phenylobacterium sp.]